MNWIDYSLIVLAILPILATLVLGAFLAKSGKHALGKPTIHPVLFFTGKFLLFTVWALFAVIAVFPEYRNLVPFLIQDQTPEVQKLMAVVFLIPANLIIVPAYLSMGLVTNIGLPTGKHELRTGGIYKISRNPMYSSFIFLNTAAFLFLPSILLLAVMIYGMVVHHFIILGEEKFLENEFGDEYRKYKAQVPRYL
ncbi:MAG TPA: isoprenylcysteine carboxylmethyltransferase family protein [Prolixibacteraceae bacterium]|nr:isoprenylcysteine carboxylmethyltransferase family protein [Prolixibacteraceae bacterium]